MTVMAIISKVQLTKYIFVWLYTVILLSFEIQKEFYRHSHWEFKFSQATSRGKRRKKHWSCFILELSGGCPKDASLANCFRLSCLTLGGWRDSVWSDLRSEAKRFVQCLQCGHSALRDDQPVWRNHQKFQYSDEQLDGQVHLQANEIPELQSAQPSQLANVSRCLAWPQIGCGSLTFCVTEFLFWFFEIQNRMTNCPDQGNDYAF